MEARGVLMPQVCQAWPQRPNRKVNLLAKCIGSRVRMPLGKKLPNEHIFSVFDVCMCVLVCIHHALADALCPRDAQELKACAHASTGPEQCQRGKGPKGLQGLEHAATKHFGKQRGLDPVSAPGIVTTHRLAPEC